MDDVSLSRVIDYSIEIFSSLPLPLKIFIIFCSLLSALRNIADYFLERELEEKITLKK